MLKWLLDRGKPVDLDTRRHLQEVEERVHRLEIQLVQLRELHEQLQAHHDRLRSKIWGYIGASMDKPLPDPKLRRSAGNVTPLTPGAGHADILNLRMSRGEWEERDD